MAVGPHTTALVTGAAQGLGRAFAAALVERGARVTLVDVQPVVAEVARSIGAVGVVADVSRPDGATRAVEAAGDLDVLVSNAGVVRATRFDDPVDETLADVDRMIGTNLVGPLLLGRLVLPGMAARGHGHVVHVSTDHVHTCGWPEIVDHAGAAACPWHDSPRPPGGGPRFDVYDASKFGLLGLTRAWAVALRDRGVQVNDLCLGATDTPMLRAFLGGDPAPEVVASWMRPEAVAEVLLALLDERPGRSGDQVGLWMGHPTVLPLPGRFALTVG